MQLGHKAGHLLLERFTIVFNGLGPDVTTRGKNIAVSSDVGCSSGFGKASHILVFVCAPVAAPCMVGIDDFGDVGFCQFAVYPVDEGAKLAGIDKESLLAAVATFAVIFIFATNQRQTGICVE